MPLGPPDNQIYTIIDKDEKGNIKYTELFNVVYIPLTSLSE